MSIQWFIRTPQIGNSFLIDGEVQTAYSVAIDDSGCATINGSREGVSFIQVSNDTESSLEFHRTPDRVYKEGISVIGGARRYYCMIEGKTVYFDFLHELENLERLTELLQFLKHDMYLNA